MYGRRNQLASLHNFVCSNERVLPTLDSNIKDGNSLIEIHFYGEELDFGEEKKIKPFSWKKGFTEVFKQGGFDVAIGNPPYVAIDGIGQSERNYFTVTFPILKLRSDLTYLVYLLIKVVDFLIKVVCLALLFQCSF